MNINIKRIIEGLLFVAEAPLNAAQIAQILEAPHADDVQVALNEIKAEYEAMERAFTIVEVGGGYIFRSRSEMAPWVSRLRKQQASKLSRAALETLAIVAYKQPVLRAEIERIRGVDVGGVIRMLMERGLLRVAGRRDLPGKPLVYATTKRFLEFFDLKDISELPTLEEIDKLTSDPDQAMEAQQLLDFPEQRQDDEEPELPYNSDGREESPEEYPEEPEESTGQE